MAELFKKPKSLGPSRTFIEVLNDAIAMGPDRRFTDGITGLRPIESFLEGATQIINLIDDMTQEELKELRATEPQGYASYQEMKQPIWYLLKNSQTGELAIGKDEGRKNIRLVFWTPKMGQQ